MLIKNILQLHGGIKEIVSAARERFRTSDRVSLYRMFKINSAALIDAFTERYRYPPHVEEKSNNNNISNGE